MKTHNLAKFIGTAIFAALVLTGCGGSGNNNPGGGNDPGNNNGSDDQTAEIDTRWYTSNPDASAFQISTAGQLAGLAQIVNSGTDNFIGKTVTLTRDVNLSAFGQGADFNNGRGWIPIGNRSQNRPFGGTFDGGGKTVSGLYINNSSQTGAGLFGFSTGTIKNVNATGTVFGRSDVGGIVGFGRAENCAFEGTVVASNNNAGGIVGTGSADRCRFKGHANGIGNVGGIAGSVENNAVTNSYSSGDVRGRSNVGGLVGTLAGTEWTSEKAIVSNSYSTSAVTAESRYAGGLVGLINIDGTTADIAVVSNCAALNPSVTWQNEGGGRAIGHISYNEGGTTGATLSNIAAFSGMAVRDFSGTFAGDPILNGEDIEKSAINSDGTIGARFTSANGWTTATGKLPGIGATVDMPEHLQ